MKSNQPTVAERLVAEPWPLQRPAHVDFNRSHAREERRSLWRRAISANAPMYGFPSARQMILMVRERYRLDGTSLDKVGPEVAYFITSLPKEAVTPEGLATTIRGHWGIENRVHWVRDVTFDEDRSRVRTGAGPQVMAAMRNLAISIHRLGAAKNIARATRQCSQNCLRAFDRLCASRRSRPPAMSA